MGALVVYGEPRLLRAQIGRLEVRGRHLLSQVDRREATYKGPKAFHGGGGRFAPMMYHHDVTGSTLSGSDRAVWESSLMKFSRDAFGDAGLAFKVVQVEKWDGSPTTAAALLAAERTAIAANLELLEDMRAAIPSSVTTHQWTYAPRLDELRRSDLLSTEAIDGYVARMSKNRTRPQMASAIGASKELVEATLRAALNVLDVEYTIRDDFPTLAKLYRVKIGAMPKFAPEAATVQTLIDVEQRATLLIDTLAPLRNKHGDGHGRLQHAKNLRPRHARLAADVAETYVRYVVLTLEDMRLI